MKIFGTIYPFIETVSDSSKHGRHIANSEFLSALLEYSSFDEFHLFCMSVGHFNATARAIERMGLPKDRIGRVRIYLYQYLFEQLKAVEYEVFHLGGWGYFFPGLAYLRSKYAKRPFPITGIIHSLNGKETPFHALKMSLAPLLPFDTIICSSVAGKRAIENIFGRSASSLSSTGLAAAYHGKFAVIPLGFNESMLQSIDRTAARKGLSIREDDVMVLSVARFSPATKMDLVPLLHAFKRATSSMPHRAVLVLAGGGSESSIKLIHETVTELGILESVRIVNGFPDDRKPQLYAAADCFVSVSDNLQETFGIALVEAMAFGLPILASDIDGYKEIVDEGETGFKVPTLWAKESPLDELDDVMDFETMQLFLAQSLVLDTGILELRLKQLIDDRALRSRLGGKGREKALREYRWSSVIKRYEDLWNTLAAEAHGYTETPVSAANPFANDYPATFGHYPTNIMNAEFLIGITESGRAALTAKKIPVAYADIAAFVPEPFVLAVLQHLTEQTSTVGITVTAMAGILEKSWIEFGLLWMAKYSLIRITQPEPA